MALRQPSSYDPGVSVANLAPRDTKPKLEHMTVSETSMPSAPPASDISTRLLDDCLSAASKRSRNALVATTIRTQSLAGRELISRAAFRRKESCGELVDLI